MDFKAETIKQMSREWAKAVVTLIACALVGVFIGWLWAFLALAVVYAYTMLALTAALGLMMEGRADRAALDAKLDAVERRMRPPA